MTSGGKEHLPGRGDRDQSGEGAASGSETPFLENYNLHVSWLAIADFVEQLVRIARENLPDGIDDPPVIRKLEKWRNWLLTDAAKLPAEEFQRKSLEMLSLTDQDEGMRKHGGAGDVPDPEDQ